MNTNINFATATHAELAAAGYTVDVRHSQRTRKHKSVFGVRPSANRAGCNCRPATAANETGRGVIN